MHPHIERCLTHLNWFAESLGWPELTPNYHNADGLDVVWYTSGENDGDASDLFLQTNEHPNRQYHGIRRFGFTRSAINFGRAGIPSRVPIRITRWIPRLLKLMRG